MDSRMVPEPLVYRYRPDALWALKNSELRERLSWYYSVLFNEAPAKYLIAKRIKSPVDPYEPQVSLEELWKVHDSLSAIFKEEWKRIANGAPLGEVVRPNYLDVKVAIAKRMMKRCELCEWRCRVNREEKIGVCRVGRECFVYSYFHHLGEEAPLVPSGTIFYGGCNFRCAFCQNWDISQVKSSRYEVLAPKALAEAQEELAIWGARNINHVGGEPTPHIPFILESLLYLDTNVAQLWNSNMYMSREAMKLLKDVIDIWLPDLKYGNDSCARRLSGVKNYFAVATRNILEAYEEGEGSVIVRHLVLPNHLECCTRPVLRWLAEKVPGAVLNLMDQYRPEYKAAEEPERYPDISRRLTREEFRRAVEMAEGLGYRFTQEELMIRRSG
ncbi:MAG: radical SAM protein [Acidilobaceae archaeon]|nr:radical SAM protein [Acidilobaceae archaeon]MCX8165472.1 radical SAM protein [Acidilobaceae archaeon]MDW7973899.1 radical SAM protein [Sulfolobales archaeon]